MTEAEWNNSGDPGQLLKHIDKRSPQSTSYRKLALLLVGCLEELCDDPGTTAAADVAARYAEGRPVTMPEWEEALASSGGPTSTPASYIGAVMFLERHKNLNIRRPAIKYVRELVAAVRPGWSGKALRLARCHLIRDIFGNPFRPVAFDPSWRTEAVVSLARGVYDSRDFAPLPVLADALEDAGCADADVLAHCRGPGPHARGCWVVDLVLGKA